MFTRARNWVTDKANAINPQASLFDQEDDNFAGGLNNCVTKDGLNKPSATMDWNNQRLTNLGAATARTDAMQTAQYQDGGPISLSAVSGTDTIVGTLTPAITAYANLMRVSFIPAATNTGAATLNVNSVAARSIVKTTGIALVAGDLVLGVPASVIYDLANTRWVLQTNVKVPDAALSANMATYNGSAPFTVAQTFNASGAAVVLKGTGAGAANAVFVQFNDSASVTKGYVGDAGAGDADITLASVAGGLHFLANNADVFSLSTAGVVTTPGASASEVGYQGSPANVQNGNYGIVLTDCGKTIMKQSGAGNTITIPANGTIAIPIGSIIAIDNDSGSSVSVSITTDVLELAGAGTTGTRTLSDNGCCTLQKIAATKWRISGSGVS